MEKLNYIKINKFQTLYLLIISLFLLLVFFGVKKKADLSVALPIHDSLSYYSKSQIVWEAIDQRDWKKAFSNNNFRPPLTALIFYPLGFKYSIKSFYLRATWAPIVLWAVALSILLMPIIKSRDQTIMAMGLTLGLLALPLFYHLEYSWSEPLIPCTQWGMVDGLEASVAAVSVALAILACSRQSKWLVLLAWLVCAGTFFIKPAGVLVFGCLFILFGTEFCIRFFVEKEKKNTFSFVIFSMVCGMLITALSLLLAFQSGYLSKELLNSLMQMQHTWTAVRFVERPLFQVLQPIFIPILGIWCCISMSVFIIFLFIDSFYKLIKGLLSSSFFRLLGLVILIGGILYWWLYLTPQEPRYLYPFFLFTISWLLLPFFLSLSYFSRPVKYVLAGNFVIPAGILIVLLFSPSGMRSVERFFGYNLQAGKYKEEVRAVKEFIDKNLHPSRPVNIYTFEMSHEAYILVSIDWINSIEIRPYTRSFYRFYFMDNWIDPGVKIREVMATHYFFMGEGRAPEKINDIHNWQEEEVALRAFIVSLGTKENSGVTLSRCGNSFVYQVTDRARFIQEFNEWVNSLNWYDRFFERNAFKKGDYYLSGPDSVSIATIEDDIRENGLSIPKIEFGSLLEIMGICKSAPLNSQKSTKQPISHEINYTFYFRAKEKLDRRYILFVHLLDAKKNIIDQYDFPLNSAFESIEPATLWGRSIKVSAEKLKNSTYFAMGVYIPDVPASFLKFSAVEAIDSDWEGQRVTLSLSH